MTLQGTVDTFINHLAEQKKANATIIAYKKDIEQLVEHLTQAQRVDFSAVSTKDIDLFLQKLSTLSFTPKTISRKINSLKTFYRFLETKGYIKTNITASISHPKFEAKAPRVLSRIEYRALRDACRDDIRIAAVVELLLQTGMRIGELAALTLESIKDSFVSIPVIEGHPGREVPLNKPARAAVDSYLSIRPKVQTTALFVTKTGRPLLIRNIRTAIDRYFRLAGIKDAKVNDLRHTFVVHHLAAGTSPILVSKLVGHKRISTTEKYQDFVKDFEVGKVKLEEL